MLEQSNDNALVAKLMSGRSGKMKSYIAVLLVSVGTDNFEKETIKSAIKMINQEFKACCIAVADTLQRYNIASEHEISPEEAYEESLSKGEEWLERYTPYFENTFEIPYEIIKWDQLLQEPFFDRKKKYFNHVLKSNSLFSQAMTHSTEEYGQRLQKRLGEEAYSRIFLRHKANCLSYLTEECVALSFLPKNIKIAKENCPSVIVYPGKSTAILTANRDLFIKEEFNELSKQYDDFMNWLPYRFNKVKPAAEVVQYKQEKLPQDKTKMQHDLVQIDNIKMISEVQLNSVWNFFDDKEQKDFNDKMLHILLHNEQIIPQENSVDYSSTNTLATFFSAQMQAIFTTLEPRNSNQCKAHLIKMIKKRQSALLL